jgi:N-acetyl-anhydromuramyl-L-alanine amidase AmpD
MDPGGYDAYRVERRFSPYSESSWETSKVAVKSLTTPNRYGLRQSVLSTEEVERVRGGGWALSLLQEKVDQFVIHYDASGTSRRCFNALQDVRGLSIHFMLDLDGTIYQTLDLKERAWHATSSNSRSIGIELANVGAYSPTNAAALREWYQRDDQGQVRVLVPQPPGEDGIRTPNFIARPARAEPVLGTVQDQELLQYDFTPQQYRALIKLTATLCQLFPRLKCDYPRDGSGNLVTHKLPDADLMRYQGVLGHFHIQTNKADPGPAFQWDRVIHSARRWMRREEPAVLEKAASRLIRRER